jgi:hypothetical protein
LKPEEERIWTRSSLAGIGLTRYNNGQVSACSVLYCVVSPPYPFLFPKVNEAKLAADIKVLLDRVNALEPELVVVGDGRSVAASLQVEEEQVGFTRGNGRGLWEGLTIPFFRAWNSCSHR